MNPDVRKKEIKSLKNNLWYEINYMSPNKWALLRDQVAIHKRSNEGFGKEKLFVYDYISS